MSQQAIVAQTDQVASVSVSNNFRMHTIGVSVSGGVLRIDARVPGGDFEPVMDTDTLAPVELDGTECIVINETSLDTIRFKPDGATYSAVVTSQAAD